MSQSNANTASEKDFEALKTKYKNRFLKFSPSAPENEYNQRISELQREINNLEIQVFDGGFNAKRFELVQFLRELSRDVYNLKLAEDSKIYYEKK